MLDLRGRHEREHCAAGAGGECGLQRAQLYAIAQPVLAFDDRHVFAELLVGRKNRKECGFSGTLGHVGECALGAVGKVGARALGHHLADGATLVPQLRRNISLKLTGVSVEQALREIGKRANVPITYNDAILPKTTSVWLTRDDIRTDEALEMVLQSAGLRIMALSTGQLVVVNVPASEASTGPPD